MSGGGTATGAAAEVAARAAEAAGVSPSTGSRVGIHPETGEPLEVIILNQYYEPDVASTGHLLHELACELVKLGFRVQVLTSRPSYGPPETWVDCPMRENLDGVDVRRLWTTRFSKDVLIGRAVNYLTFMGQLFLRVLLTSRRHSVYLYTTNPPFLSAIGALVSLVRRHRYVILLHDAYPQMAVWVGTIREGGLLSKLWHWTNRLCYRRSRQAIVLCQKAKQLVCRTYLIERDDVHVIPNWADGEMLRKLRKQDSEFARTHGLLDHFVVMYSGNIGLYYEFETVLGAAERLRDEPFRLVLIGSGGKRGWIEKEIERRGLMNTLLLPYQPFEKLNDSLSSADASLVSIDRGIEGISFPSKLYTSLAVGRPILALSEPGSELRDLVDGHGVGRFCELGDIDTMERIIREMIADSEGCDAMGERARALFEKGYTKERSAAAYAQVLRHSHPLVREGRVAPHETIGVER